VSGILAAAYLALRVIERSAIDHRENEGRHNTTARKKLAL
jgi:hypothetical protein